MNCRTDLRWGMKLLTMALIATTAKLVMLSPSIAQEGVKFNPGCTIPFESIAPNPPGNPIDEVCGPEGVASKPAGRAQNAMKNNLCATGEPVRMTRFSFIQLQRAVDNAGIKYGNASSPVEDRSKLVDLYKTSDGKTVGEGSLVRFAAFVLDAHYSNVSKGEGVNCKETGQENNDIHVAMAETPNADDCESVTVEIIPHYRPSSWTPDVLNDLGRPVRITGQLFFDGSHHPCADGNRSSPARVSVWEIHPVYGIDICKNTTLASCKADDDTKWTPVHEWFALEESAGEMEEE